MGEQENAAAAAALAAVGAQDGEIDSAVVCMNDIPRSCSLDHAVAVFATTEPIVGGDTAQVVAKALWMANLAKQPVQEGVFRIGLRREGGWWRVVRTETLFIS